MPEKESGATKYSWVLQWIFWSSFMILFTGVGEPLYKDEPITITTLLHEAVLWIPGGLVFALVNRFFNKRQQNKQERK